MNELTQLTSHLKDLANRSFQNSIYTFSSFLSEEELAVLFQLEKELSYAGITIYGGTEEASRCMVRFGKETELGYNVNFPIQCLKIEPLSLKFGEELSHRDYLGAFMSLGIERNLLGDIMIDKKTAYAFCSEHIADFISEKLTQIRHTSVRITILEECPQALQPQFEAITIIAPSERLDAIISKIYNLSRSQSLTLFRSKKIFINGRQCENNSIVPKDGDRISVRGFGKFIYDSIASVTGKGRFRISIRLYK